MEELAGETKVEKDKLVTQTSHSNELCDWLSATELMRHVTETTEKGLKS